MPNVIDPGMQQVTLFMPRAEADALIKRANAAGLSRSELIRRMCRDLLTETTGSTQ